MVQQISVCQKSKYGFSRESALYILKQKQNIFIKARIEIEKTI